MSSSSASKASKAPEPAAGPALPFANDGSFMEQFLKMQQQQQAGKGEPEAPNTTAATTTTTAPAIDEQPDYYIASSSFTGVKVGYSFKAGSRGTGYYKDAPSSPAASSTPTKSSSKPSGKPIIIKSKPIISIQKRTGSGGEIPEAKKKKETSEEDDGNKSFYQKEMERYRAKTCGSDTAHDRPLVK